MKKEKTMTLAMTVALLIGCMPADGQEGGAAKGGAKAPASVFDQIDTNRDGVLSKAEILAYFTKLDGNQDGSVTREEFGAGEGGRKAGEDGGKKGAEGGKKGGKGEGGSKKGE